MQKIKKYFIEAIAEMKKVTWPTRKETYNYTILVIVATLGLAAFIFALDTIFSKALAYFIAK
ncbi:MAG TPA: preprotein translocase subunit SecE [bacterium]|nr:preprotein translocase subunit SecE [bacterium]